LPAGGTSSLAAPPDVTLAGTVLDSLTRPSRGAHAAAASMMVDRTERQDAS